MACCGSPQFFLSLLLLALLGAGFSAAFVPLRPGHVLVRTTRTSTLASSHNNCITSNSNAPACGFLVQRAAATSTIIERAETVILPAGPAVLERPTTIERQQQHDVDRVPSKQQRQRQGSEAWEVRIYNDGLNTREHVARSLVQVTGLSELQAYQTMMQAHQNGIAAVGRWVYEVAEMYHDALKKKGIVCDIIPVDEE